MISRGKELLRICPSNNLRVEFSVNGGRSWLLRFSGTISTGSFSDLMDNGREVLGRGAVHSGQNLFRKQYQCLGLGLGY